VTRASRWVLAAAVLGALPCAAQDVTRWEAPPAASASPRRALLEFKGSPFTPDIDKKYASGAGPYQTTFGGKPMLLGELELDVEVWQGFGTLSIAASGGYAEMYGHALTEAGDKSAEATGLHVVPLKLLVLWRADMFWPKFSVPLAPYVKVGPVLMPWWSTKGGDIEVVNGYRGAGYKLGIAATAGIALVLDFLDPRLALDFDTFSGVNHTAIFAEWTYQNMTLFDFSKSAMNLDLSSKHWSFGISFEF
jgi:hypothetical protein